MWTQVFSPRLVRVAKNSVEMGFGRWLLRLQTSLYSLMERKLSRVKIFVNSAGMQGCAAEEGGVGESSHRYDRKSNSGNTSLGEASMVPFTLVFLIFFLSFLPS